MNEPNYFLTICLIVFNITYICIYVKHKIKIKKDIGHYEAIADEHSMKMYNPLNDCIVNLILLFVFGFKIGWVYLLIGTYLITKLQSSYNRMILLQSSIDILSLKQGLITMFPSYNAYSECGEVDIEVDDVYNYDGECNNEAKKLIYIFKEKPIYHEIIDTKDKSEDEIEKIKCWHLNRFRDYMRYIPKEIYNKEDPYYELLYWFTYLDSVRKEY